MTEKKGILIICNLDARSEELKFVKPMIEAKGHRAILMDVSMGKPPPFPGDITCDEVAEAGGLSIETVREYIRTKKGREPVDNQIRGATKIAQELAKKGEIQGVIGLGGGTNTVIATSVMQSLPFGMPKIMVSHMATYPAYIPSLVGVKDIVMFPTVVEFSRMNTLLKAQIVNGVGAICGMVEATQGTEFVFDRPTVAITLFGFVEKCAEQVMDLLDKAGFQPISFCSLGVRDSAMEHMIREQSWFSGVIDIAPQISANLFDDNMDEGPNRLISAIEAGIPLVVAPGGLDRLSYGSRPDKVQVVESRRHFSQDPTRIQVRTTAEELIQTADVAAERLNRAKGPFKVVIPLKGWSSLDIEDGPLYDPETDAAFTKELKKRLNKKEAIEEMDVHIFAPEFAQKLVDEFIKLYEEYKKSK